MKKTISTIFIAAFTICSCASPKEEVTQGNNNTPPQENTKPDNEDETNTQKEYDILIENLSQLTQISIKPGMTIAIKNGTYHSQNIYFSGNGAEGQPVTLIAEKPGQVKFIGNSSLTLNGSYLKVNGFIWENPENKQTFVVKFDKNASFCSLENCAITGFETQEDTENDSKWISIYGTHNSISHCTFNDKRNIGALCVVWLEEGKEAYHHISHNYFSRPVTLYDKGKSPINGQEIIRIGDSSHSLQNAYCLVDSNYFYHCHGEMAEIISNKSCKNTYSDNGFYECKGTLTLRHGNDCLVTGNYFIGNNISQTGGVRIIGENHVVENNRFETLGGEGYKSALCIVRGQENNPLNGYAPVKNAIIRDNIFLDCKLSMHINYKGTSSQSLAPISTQINHNTIIAIDSNSYVIKYESSSPEAEISWNSNNIFGKISNDIFHLIISQTKPLDISSTHNMNNIKLSAGTFPNFSTEN